MARELRDRYARMSDVVADLKRVADGNRPLGPHGTWGRTPPRWAARAALVAIAVLLGAGLFVAARPYLGFGRRPPVARAFIARTIDLTDLIEPALDATPDAAVRGPDGIRLTRGSIASDRTFLVFPYEPPDEYDLIIEFERTSGDGRSRPLHRPPRPGLYLDAGRAGEQRLVLLARRQCPALPGRRSRL